MTTHQQVADGSIQGTPDKATPGKRISNYGIIGYGIDVITTSTRAKIADFTYNKPEQVFRWNGEDIRVPDQINLSQSPHGDFGLNEFSGRMSTARDIQLKMKNSFRVSGEDPETDLTFSAYASSANEMMSTSDSRSVFSLYEAEYTYVFLGLTQVNIDTCLTQAVRRAAVDCRKDRHLIRMFYDTFGTHFVKSADVGGLLHIRTSIRLNAETSKEAVESNLDIGGSVQDENGDYAKGRIDFNVRDDHTSKLYRNVSVHNVECVGGLQAAPNVRVWGESLLESQIPTWEDDGVSNFVNTGRFVGKKPVSENVNLGLVNVRYGEIYKYLGLYPEQEQAFKAVLSDCLSGVNPFKNDTYRLKPDMDYSHALKKGQKATFDMIGWFATYETYVGLAGKPGSRALVRCKSDAEWSGWTEKMVYAGEKIQLRNKTAYLSAYMVVEFMESFDDDGATVFAVNKLVPW